MTEQYDYENPASAGHVMDVEEAVRAGHVPRRERIATAVLAGLTARTQRLLQRDGGEEYESVAPLAASMAVEWADALIAELDK